jgi:membrane fusion protein, multidrug efflux system
MTFHPRKLTAEKAIAPRGETVQPAPLPAIPTAQGPATPEPKRGVRTALKKILLVGVGLAAVAAAADFGWRYWTVGQFQVATDDAYVKADNTTISPKVSGYISAVLVGDNQTVRAGQVLARIDDRDFSVAQQQADADVAASHAAIATKEAALDAQQSIIEAARAGLAVDEASATFAEQDDKRYSSLAATGFGSVQNAQQAASRIASARAAVARDTASVASATKQIDVLKAELEQARAALARSEAARRQADLNLS